MERTISLPLVKKELRQNLRGPATLVLENAYVVAAAVAAIVVCVKCGEASDPSWQTGKAAFWMLTWGQAAMVTVLGAASGASSTSVEQEQKTLDIILSTPLTHRELVWGKLLGGSSISILGVALLDSLLEFQQALSDFFIGCLSRQLRTVHDECCQEA